MELRQPANLVSPRAKMYWSLTALLWWGAVALAQVVSFMIFDGVAWWRWALFALTLIVLAVDATVVSQIRYRTHRWEVTPTAVYTQAGWWSLERRVAPISRVQTVDTKRGALQRALGLSTVTVTTASAAGEMTIDCLDQRVADELVAHLTVVAEQSPDDAT